MVKTIKDIFLRNRKADDLETLYTALSTRVLLSIFKLCPWVDTNIFYGKVKFVPYVFAWEKVKIMDVFQKLL